MNEPGFFKAACPFCGQPVEVPETIGDDWITCPNDTCGKSFPPASQRSPLPPPLPRTAISKPRKTLGVGNAVGLCFLGTIGLVVYLFITGALVRNSGGSEESASKNPPGPDVEVSQIKAELLGYHDGKFSYMEITGIIKNRHPFALNGLFVRISVIDDDGNKTDEAFASVSSLDGNGTWKFKARTSEVGVCTVEGVSGDSGKLRAAFPEGTVCKIK